MFGAYAPLPLRLGDDWTAPQHARFCADLVAVKRTIATARWSYTKSGSTVTISNYYGMQGSGPTHVPDSVVVNGTGDVTFLWTDEYFVDPYGVMYPLAVKHAGAKVRAASSGSATVTLADNGVRVRTFNDAGSATDLPVSVRIW